jgi:hypothetical protein
MRTRLPTLAVMAVALLACADQPAPESAATAAAAGESVRCIDVDRIVSRLPEGPRSLRFEMTGDAVYRNELDRACPPLEQATDFDILTLQLDGPRACAGDTFQVVDASEARAVGFRAFPRCRLGRFVRVAETSN